jgi:hypothetical protein
MNLLFVAVVILAFAAFALLAVAAKKRTGAQDVRYSLRPSLLTPAELAFVQALTAACPSGAYIAPKVRLADIFDAPQGDRGAFARISQKHVDFLLIDKESGRPLVGIELDDRSHQRADRRARDEVVDRIFASAKLPLLHVKARATYSAATLAGMILDTMSPKTPQP